MTGYFSERNEPIYEGHGFMFNKDGKYLHMDRQFIYPKYKDPRNKFGGVFYDEGKQEWWVQFVSNPELNKRLKDIKGVYKK